MLEEKLQTIKKVINGGIAGFSLLAGLGSCAPAIVQSRYLPPPILTMQKHSLDFQKMRESLLGLLKYKCEGIGVDYNQIICTNEETKCVEWSGLRPVPYCEDVHHPASPAHGYFEGREAYTSQKCGVREETTCLKEETHTLTTWTLDKKYCQRVYAEIKERLDGKDDVVSSVVIELLPQPLTLIEIKGLEVSTARQVANILSLYCEGGK